MRSPCGALLLVPFLAIIGDAQAPGVPTGNGHISGRILTSTSEPIAGATVVLGLNETGAPFESSAWWATTSDGDGLFEFAALPAGRFVAIAAKSGFVGWDSIPTAAAERMIASGPFPALALAHGAPQLVINLVPGGQPSDVNLALHRPASISGRALWPDGSPAGNERVMLYTADEKDALTGSLTFTPTDTGAYVFRDLPPGAYYLGLGQPGPLSSVDRSTLTPITVSEGMALRNVDVSIVSDRAFAIVGRVVDALGQVPRMVQLEYGVPGARHRGLLSVSAPDGRFRIRDRGIEPGPLTIIGRGETDEGPMIGLSTVMTIDGPNEVEIVVGKPGSISGRVSLGGGVPFTGVGGRLALVREGFQPLGEPDQMIEIAPDGWLEAANLIGEYRLRVEEPQQWTVKSVRRRGLRLANNRLIVRMDEALDDVEIVIGPR